MTEKKDKNFNYIVRVMNADLDGHKKVVDALRKIKGVSFMLANAVCSVSGVSKTAIMGSLSDSDVEKLQNTLSNISSSTVPSWLLNRRKDYSSGADKHLLSNDLRFSHESDIRRLRKIKSYRGLRLAVGLPVRGQRTKSNFRKNKGKKR